MAFSESTLKVKDWFVTNLDKICYKRPFEIQRDISREFNISESHSKAIYFRYLAKLLEKVPVKKADEVPKFTTIEQTETFKQAAKREYDKDKKRFIITYAQNHTPVHKQFLENIELYSNFLDASIHVIAGRYKNPTSVFSDHAFEDWDPIVQKYLDANRHDIHKYCSILSDVKVQPTASTPLSGLNSITGLSSCIVGHPRMHLTSLPVLKGYHTKTILTTGAITLPNYTDSKAGKKGEFHHSFGFAIVEIDGEYDDGVCHIRQVTANDDGSFHDLYFKVDQKIEIIETCKVATLGDIHLGYHCHKSIYAAKSYLSKVVPGYTIIHDLFDGASVNPHEMKDAFVRLRREEDGTDHLGREIDFMMKWIDRHRYLNLVVVRSNHDDFLDRWLINTDWHRSPHKLLYLKLANIIAEGKAPKGLIPYLIDEKFPDVKTLGVNDSFRVDDIEYGMHGDRGANGSRGSITQFKSLNTKCNTGHAHSDARADGHFQVGCMTVDMEYAKGLSSWTRSMVITHNDWKRQHIRFLDGKFTTIKI